MAFRWRADSCPILRALWDALLTCSLYNDLRGGIFSIVSNHIAEFDLLDPSGKLSVILGTGNEHVIRFRAKTCLDILDRRRAFLYK